jgi:hypothetical protein
LLPKDRFGGLTFVSDNPFAFHGRYARSSEFVSNQGIIALVPDVRGANAHQIRRRNTSRSALQASMICSAICKRGNKVFESLLVGHMSNPLFVPRRERTRSGLAEDDQQEELDIQRSVVFNPGACVLT